MGLEFQKNDLDKILILSSRLNLWDREQVLVFRFRMELFKNMADKSSSTANWVKALSSSLKFRWTARRTTNRPKSAQIHFELGNDFAIRNRFDVRSFQAAMPPSTYRCSIGFQK